MIVWLPDRCLNGESDGRLTQQGCQLMQWQSEILPMNWMRRPVCSSPGTVGVTNLHDKHRCLRDTSVVKCFQQDDHQARRVWMVQHCLICMLVAAWELHTSAVKCLGAHEQ